MDSNKIKIVVVMSILVLGAFIVFSFTDTGSNMAAVITGAPSNIQKCLQVLGDDSQSSDYYITKTYLNSDSQSDYIFKATTDTQCGSAGCVHELCVIKNGTAKIVPFGYAAEKLIVKNTLTNQMHDIQLTGKSTTNFQWDGTRYIVVR